MILHTRFIIVAWFAATVCDFLLWHTRLTRAWAGDNAADQPADMPDVLLHERVSA